MRIENFYHRNKYGYVVQDLAINYDKKTYKIGEKRRTRIANEKLKEIKELGFKEEQDV